MIQGVSRSAMLAVLAGSATFAGAETVLISMRYDSLSGSYNSALQEFRARAADTAALRSTGAVSRLVPTTGTALFEAGFVSAANSADFDIRVSAIPTGNPLVRTGSGLFVATDVDGDTISGVVNGTWYNGGPGFIFFNGTLSNVILTSSGAAPENGTFDGSNGGSWDMNIPAPQPYEGAIVQLVFGAPNFFLQDFQDRATGVTAQLVPAPGALVLMGLGGLAMTRRRR
ncbi:MAG: hypothetical protein HBSAPP03_17250 [Phycisphaerae bacterium]|nr:MAG: hypothetical protein HBSAPP03_17250 [Phycisphaerae bacterium]